MPKNSKSLTIRELRFVEHYFGDSAGNGTDAARKAGYAGNDNVLAVTANKLLNKPKIHELVKSNFGETSIPTLKILSEQIQRLTKDIKTLPEKQQKQPLKNKIKTVDRPVIRKSELTRLETLMTRVESSLLTLKSISLTDDLVRLQDVIAQLITYARADTKEVVTNEGSN